MTVARKLSLFGLVLSVAACGSAEVSTRNAPFEALPDTTLSAPQGYQQISPAAAEAPVDCHQRRCPDRFGGGPIASFR